MAHKYSKFLTHHTTYKLVAMELQLVKLLMGPVLFCQGALS